MSSEDYTACHWRRLSDILLCQSTDFWNAHQIYLNRAYIRDKKEIRRGQCSDRIVESSNLVAEQTENTQKADASSCPTGDPECSEERPTEERAIYIGDVEQDLSKEMQQCSLSAQVLDTLSDVSSSEDDATKLSTAANSNLVTSPSVEDQGRLGNTAEADNVSASVYSDDEAALMKAMGLPTSFVASKRRRHNNYEESSGDLSDDEALVCNRRAKQKRSKRWRKAADELHNHKQRLNEKDKALRRRFDDFWREKGTLLKYTAFIQAYGRYLGDDFWRTVPASVARDEYLSQMMPQRNLSPAPYPANDQMAPVVDPALSALMPHLAAGGEGGRMGDGPPPAPVGVDDVTEEEEEDDEDAVEFDWESVWPGFVMQLRNRWFMWYLYEKKVRPSQPVEAESAAMEAAVTAATGGVASSTTPEEGHEEAASNGRPRKPSYCARTSLEEELSCLGCAVDFDQLHAFEPIVVHAKTNRVAVTHSRLASTANQASGGVQSGAVDGAGPVSDDDDEDEVDRTNDGTLCELDVRDDPDLRKYWSQRYRLFSRWDEGVRLDRESWFSVTPEKIARHQAERLSECAVIVDGFCGAGGNTIQFAQFCDTVIAVDIDPTKLELAEHNARVYGVESRIHFVCGDFLKLAPTLRLDPYSTAVFLSPPWGGPAYLNQPVFDLGNFGGLSGFGLVEAARHITTNVALFAPRNANVAQLVAMTAPGELMEIEQNFLNNKMKAVTVYFGGIVDDVTASY